MAALPTAQPILLAYLHLHPGTSNSTRDLLERQIHAFALRERFTLVRILVGIEGRSEKVAVRRLVAHVRASGASTVLIAGPAVTALEAMRGMPRMRVLTLADISTVARPATGRRLTRTGWAW